MARYRSNGPRFVDESVDGEALIMDMVTGTYYTCMGPATVAWDALKQGVDSSEVVSMIASAYQVSPADVERDLELFVAELLAEEMLVVSDQRPSAPSPSGGPIVATAAYEPMRLDRYTDLADLILLDPVHDVSGADAQQE